jgi:hypothetical protein
VRGCCWSEVDQAEDPQQRIAVADDAVLDTDLPDQLVIALDQQSELRELLEVAAVRIARERLLQQRPDQLVLPGRDPVLSDMGSLQVPADSGPDSQRVDFEAHLRGGERSDSKQGLYR